VAAHVNYADTDDQLNPLLDARFSEVNLGFAWRPHASGRWAVFGRYTYLYDIASAGEDDGEDYDQRTRVASLEGVYSPNARWEFAAKLARREGEVRFGRQDLAEDFAPDSPLQRTYQRGAGPWFDSSATFSAVQARMRLADSRWSGLAEYRRLDAAEGGLREGWLIGADREVGRNLRLGVGYNFTDFSDNLTRQGYEYEGWFLNVVGRY